MKKNSKPTSATATAPLATDIPTTVFTGISVAFDFATAAVVDDELGLEVVVLCAKVVEAVEGAASPEDVVADEAAEESEEVGESEG